MVPHSAFMTPVSRKLGTSFAATHILADSAVLGLYTVLWMTRHPKGFSIYLRTRGRYADISGRPLLPLTPSITPTNATLALPRDP
jgi:hypothetical protein